MDLPFLKLHSDNLDAEEPDEYLLADRTMPAGSFPNEAHSDGGFGDAGFGDGDFGGDFHATTEGEFGKGGDNWADGSIMGDNDIADGQGFEPLTDIKGAPGTFVMALNGQQGENILSYFDERGAKNWAGPEHWRIQRIKKGNPPCNMLTIAAAPGAPEVKKPRKEKEVFEIDFFATQDVDEDILFTTGGATINLPKTQWKSKSRNLLPDDMHFNSKQLLRLFLKPKAMLHSKRPGTQNVIRGVGGDETIPQDIDERYWAETAQRNKIITSSKSPLLQE
jgi:condensin complex subunit 2